jgi:hypothetical protein
VLARTSVRCLQQQTNPTAQDLCIQPFLFFRMTFIPSHFILVFFFLVYGSFIIIVIFLAL